MEACSSRVCSLATRANKFPCRLILHVRFVLERATSGQSREIANSGSFPIQLSLMDLRIQQQGDAGRIIDQQPLEAPTAAADRDKLYVRYIHLSFCSGLDINKSLARKMKARCVFNASAALKRAPAQAQAQAQAGCSYRTYRTLTTAAGPTGGLSTNRDRILQKPNRDIHASSGTYGCAKGVGAGAWGSRTAQTLGAFRCSSVRLHQAPASPTGDQSQGSFIAR